MSQLSRFLSRYNHFILFLLLEVIAFTLIINRNDYQRSVFARINTQVLGWVSSVTSSVTDYFSLKSDNAFLAEENAALQNELLRLKSSKNPVSAFAQSDSAFAFTSAKVVYNTVNRFQNSLILDKGSIDGVRPNMGVVTPQGVVGIVESVSKHFCTVISVLNIESRISGKVKNSNYLGSISWDGKNTTIVQMEEMPRHVEIKVGDTIVTSEHSAIFMEGMMIGTVIKAEINENDAYYKVDVRLANRFQALNYVTIVSFALRDEYDELQKTTINE